MTYADFIAQVRRELEEPTESVWADASLLQWTNDASNEVAMRTKCMRDWQYTTTVVGEFIYELPTYSIEVIEAYYDGRQLQRQDFTDWTYLPTAESTGTPRYYAIDDANIFLKPTPDASLELSFLRFMLPTPITDEEDDMPFGSRWNPAISYYVKWRAFEQIGDTNLAPMYQARYEDEIYKAIGQLTSERNSGRETSPREVW